MPDLLQDLLAADRAVAEAEKRRAEAWLKIVNSLPADEAVELLERRDHVAR